MAHRQSYRLSQRDNIMTLNDDDLYEEDAMQSRPSLAGQKMNVTIEPVESIPPRMESPSSGPLPGPIMFNNHFFSHDATVTAARKQYFKMIIGGTLMTSILIFTVFSIFWGAFYRTPYRPLPGLIVDFDGGLIGQSVIAGLSNGPEPVRIAWRVVPAEQFSNIEEVGRAIVEQEAWVAVTINPGASNRLTAALASPNAGYDGSQAVTVFATEARNENAYRGLIRPAVEGAMIAISSRFATQVVRTLGDSPVLSQLVATSPQTLTAPMYYTLRNVLPFNQPVAGVITFVGLIFLLILSFFVVMLGNTARTTTNLQTLLSFPSLIKLRFTTSFLAYFILSLFYSLLSLAFLLDTSRKFGRSGFLVFWMLNYTAMCAVGLALEAMLALITPNFVPFFMLTWIITNVAVCVMPIEVLPILYRYGYAAPFYNVSCAVRTIIFGAKNEVGFHFGVLIIWAFISLITLPLFQYVARRRDMTAHSRQHGHHPAHATEKIEA